MSDKKATKRKPFPTPTAKFSLGPPKLAIKPSKSNSKAAKPTDQKPERGSKPPKGSTPVVIADSDSSKDDDAIESDAETPTLRRLHVVKRAAPQVPSSASKRLKSDGLLMSSTLADTPAVHTASEPIARAPRFAKRHEVACRECIDKWRTDSSWVCMMTESGKRPCVSFEIDGLRCSDDMLEDSRMDVQRVHEMADRHRLGLPVDPEAWRTGLSCVLSNVETFDAWQRARSASMQVEEVTAKIERHMSKERAALKVLKEALEEEKSERKRLEVQVRVMQTQLDGLEAGKDGDDEGAEEGNVDET
ncbi:uncharacterized protein FFB14_15278 [Fusarium fujikuroi]|nr:uncharacterized protein FFB14_15278 [Fusarium fujikuroi]